jgi:tRNA nucleotidyltransferase (CCA-adding enzyme)
MIPIPPPLQRLVEHLASSGIRAIFVGGFVRDYFTGHATSDLDIELYGVTSLDTLETLLRPFGKVGLYGKSFGVLKLTYEGYHIDFSPPRTESKSGFGHKGFEIAWHSDLSFSAAARRRDFTINAIGYDPLTHALLDPYGGVEDLDAKILRCVDPDTFVDDPLRILRAIQFAARFELTCDETLTALCTTMIEHGALDELPKERIFEEFKKLFLLSQRPSIGLQLLAQMGGKYLFDPLTEDAWSHALDTIDTVAARRSPNPLHALGEMFAALLIDSPDPQSVLERLIDQRDLLRTTMHIIRYARRSGRFTLPPEPLLLGRDLIAQGLKPSEAFKTILENAYDAQLEGAFATREEALQWLVIHL